MAGLKEIKNRITSVGSTIQITSAMKMVSASKLKKAQEATLQMRPYANSMKQILQNVCAALDTNDIGSPFIEQRSVNKILFVVIASNRGLCGAFNSSLIKKINHRIEEKYAKAEVSFLTVGRKAYNILSKQHKIEKNYSSLYDELSFKKAANIAEKVMSLFSQGVYDKVEIAYNAFKNAATTILTIEQMLPVVLPKAEAKDSDYIFEPDKIKIVENLIPKSIKSQLYKAIIDSVAAEHGSRMTAMHKATDNAIDLKNELLLTYNKARQASITNEILEIVGGAEALNNA